MTGRRCPEAIRPKAILGRRTFAFQPPLSERADQWPPLTRVAVIGLVQLRVRGRTARWKIVVFVTAPRFLKSTPPGIRLRTGSSATLDFRAGILTLLLWVVRISPADSRATHLHGAGFGFGGGATRAKLTVDHSSLGPRIPASPVC